MPPHCNALKYAAILISADKKPGKRAWIVEKRLDEYRGSFFHGNFLGMHCCILTLRSLVEQRGVRLADLKIFLGAKEKI
jgi:hypothetical protein